MYGTTTPVSYDRVSNLLSAACRQILLTWNISEQFNAINNQRMTEIKAKVVLMDIEGTTTSISFVKDVLFPYAKQHAKSYLQEHWNEAQTQTLVNELLQLPVYKEFAANTLLKQLTVRDNESQDEETELAEFVNYLIDEDLKLAPLKTLQGYIWAKGYSNGSIKGHVYDDVPEALKLWKESGLRLGIYSSGSIKAQQLLFGQTEHSDLLPYITDHFDTTSGYKQEVDSYRNIARELGEECSKILFLTDIAKEAEAARKAGMQTIILNRPGNAALSADQLQEFQIVNNFKEININLA